MRELVKCTDTDGRFKVYICSQLVKLVCQFVLWMIIADVGSHKCELWSVKIMHVHSSQALRTWTLYSVVGEVFWKHDFSQ